jgi:phage gp37-like protein
MSALLLQATHDYLRGQFTRQEVATVQLYGGEFGAEDLGKISFACPAILLTILGWQPVLPGQGGRLVGRNARSVSMAAFVVTKHAKREIRMLDAVNLADRVSAALTRWRPNTQAQPYTLAPLDEDAACENLYGQKVDKAGLALWLVDWRQCVTPAPGTSWADLADLLHIEIIDTTRQGDVPAAPDAGGVTPTVTEEVNFAPRTNP